MENFQNNGLVKKLKSCLILAGIIGVIGLGGCCNQHNIDKHKSNPRIYNTCSLDSYLKNNIDYQRT